MRALARVGGSDESNDVLALSHGLADASLPTFLGLYCDGVLGLCGEPAPSNA